MRRVVVKTDSRASVEPMEPPALLWPSLYIGQRPHELQRSSVVDDKVAAAVRSCINYSAASRSACMHDMA